MDVLLLAALTLMIVFLIMQNRRRRKEVDLMQNSLTVGSEVVLHAGIKGKILSIDGDSFEIESGKGTKLLVLRGAIGKVTAAGEK